jgi:hypothetical protein
MAKIKDLGEKWVVEVGTYRANRWVTTIYRTFYDEAEAYAFYGKFN